MKLSKLFINGRAKELSNIVVIIGSNNVGKTKLLQSIYDELVGLVEDSGTEYRRDEPRTGYWRGLVQAGYFDFSDEERTAWLSTQKQWRESNGHPRVMLYRSTDYVLQIRNNEQAALPQGAYNSLVSRTQSIPPSEDQLQWQVPFKRSHIQELGVEQRFDESNQISNMTLQSGDDSSYLLYTKKSLLAELNKHLNKLFGRTMTPLMSSPSTYTVAVVKDSELNTVPSWAKTNYPSDVVTTAAEHSRFVQSHPEYSMPEQSHGTRAAISLMLALTDKTRKITFIDEPELHLYPAARRYIARFIASSVSEKQVFMVTHDPLIIDGIAASGKDFSILKIDKSRNLSLVNFDAAERRRTASELKNPQAIQAGFYDAALFVEGMDDKFIYNSVLSRKNMIPQNIEFGIIECNGGDRMKDSVKFALDIKTRVATIVDFDQLISTKKDKNSTTKRSYVETLMTAMGFDESIIQNARDIHDELKLVKWSQGKRLTDPNISPTLHARTENLLNQLKDGGIFVVPVGEAYDWFSKTKADGPVEYLQAKYFNNSKKFPELTSFMKSVANYLTR